MLIALVVSSATFMQSLDGTVIATALPRMATSFRVGAVDLSLGITAYIMTVAAMAPVAGWLAGRLGARPVFAGAIGLFTVASVLCGASHGLWPFVAARTLQGLGGSMMQPVGQLILLRSTEKRDLVRAITLATTPALIGPILGPPIGGFLTTFASWPWIFYLNIPIGLLGVLLSLRYLPNPRADEARRFDGIGFVLNAGAITALVYGLGRLGTPEGGWLQPLALVGLGLAVCAAAVRHARESAMPLLPITAFSYLTYRTTVLTAGTCLRLQLRLVPFLIPLMLQVGFGMSAFSSGLILLAHSGGDIVLKSMTTALLRRAGFRRVLLVFTVLFAASIAACGLFSRATPAWVMFAVLAVSGAFRSPLFTATSTLMYAEIPAAEIAGATALANVVQQVTGALAISLVALFLNLAVIARHGTTGSPNVADFRLAFMTSGLIALAAFVPLWRLPHDTGAEVSGHAHPPR